MTQSIAENVTLAIATIPTHAHSLRVLLDQVDEQTLRPGQIVIEYDYDHTGAAATRNRALAKVTTEFVAFFDDDDEMGRSHIESLVNHQRETNADLVYPWFWVAGQGSHDPLGAFGRPFDADRLMRANYIPIAVLARTELIKQVGGFKNYEHNGPPWEDWMCWKSMLEAGAKFSHLPVRTWTWNQNTGLNTTGDPDRW